MTQPTRKDEQEEQRRTFFGPNVQRASQQEEARRTPGRPQGGGGGFDKDVPRQGQPPKGGGGGYDKSVPRANPKQFFTEDLTREGFTRFLGREPSYDDWRKQQQAAVPRAFDDQLPVGAVGKDRHGRPYYGGSSPIGDFWNGLKARWVQPVGPKPELGAGVFDEDWDYQFNLKTAGYVLGELLQGASNIGENLRNLGTEEGEAPTPFTYLGRAFAEVPGGAGQLFETIGDVGGQAINVAAGLVEVGAQEELDSPLPDLIQGDQLSWLDKSPVGWAYNAARTALSKPSEAKTSRIRTDWQTGRVLWTDIWKTAADWVQESPALEGTGFEKWVAAHSLYESALPHTAREEVKRQIQQGVNPYLASLEVENPIAQMVGEIIFDPLNLVTLLSKPLKLRGTLALAAEDLINPAGDIGKIVGKGTIGEIGALRDFEKLAEAAHVVDKELELGIEAGRVVNTSYKKLWGLIEPTMSARKARATKRHGEFLQVFAHNITGKRNNPDMFQEVFKAWLETAHDNPLTQKTGWQTLATMANRGDIASMQPFMSNMGRETAVFLKKMAGDDPLSFLKNLKGANPVEGAEFFAKKFEKVVDEMYPDLIKRVKDAKKAGKIADIPPHLQAAARFHEMTRKVYNPINSVFAGVYMGLNPGYAVRNFLNDAATIFADEGIKAFKHPFSPQRYLDEAVAWLGGQVPDASQRAISGGIHAGEQATAKGSWGALKLAQWIEQKNAQRVVGKAVDDAMHKLLSKGLDIKPLVAAGMSEREARGIAKAVISYKGDVAKAFDAYRAEMKTGVINRFRDGSWLVTEDYERLRQHGLLDPFLNIIRDSDTIEIAHARIDAEIIQPWEAMARRSNVIDPRLTPEKGTNAVADLINQGLTFGITDEDTATFAHGYMQAYQAARHQTQVALEEGKTSLLRMFNGDTDPYNQVMGTVLGKNQFDKEVTIGDLFRSQKIDADYSRTLSKMGEKIANIDAYLVNFPNNKAALREAWKKWNLGEFPEALVNNKVEFKAEAWKKYFANSKVVNKAWREEYEGFGQMAVGLMMDQGAQISRQTTDQMQQYFQISQMWDDLADRRELAASLRTAVQGKDNRGAVYALADIFPLDEIKLGATARTTRQKDPAILNIINKWTEDMKGVGPFESLDDIPPKVAEQIFGFRAFGENWHLEDAPRPLSTMIIHSAEATPLGDQIFKNTNAGVKRWMNTLKAQISEHWDDSVRVDPSNQKHLEALDLAERTWQENVVTSRLTANKYATATRDFILHDYEDRTGLDLALSYVMPYHFWYSRTYNNWIRERIIKDPDKISAYFKYRTAMEKIHADLPEWWRYNVNSNELLGINAENPLFFNLEATLNPMKGLIESDFNDPARRVNWWTNMLDSVDNYGPTTWTPIQMLTAYGLYLQGENEAAARWGGRMIPQTNQIRGVTALLNIGGEGGLELDPFVHMFSGGIGVYERRRAGRILSEWVEQGVLSQEEALDAARTQSGEAWDAAVAQEADRRAPSNLQSYFMGVGFKGRSQADMQIDVFYDDYYKLMDRWEDLSPQEIRQSFDWLRERYPFMDTLMLSRKVGVERDRAYAYNVLGRIPPGQKDDIFKMVGLSPDLYGEFYENKGDLNKFDAGQKDDFMDLVVDLGAILEMPDSATRYEWSLAKDAYDRMRERQKEAFGEDIDELISMYFELGTDNQEREWFSNKYPQVQQALDYQTQQSYLNPHLQDYYISIKKVEDYFRGQLWDRVEKELGSDIFDRWDQYYDLKLTDPKAAKAFYKENEEDFDLYRSLRDGYKRIVAERMVIIEGHLREESIFSLRENDDLTQRQEGLAEQLTAPDPRREIYNYTWQDWQNIISPAQSRLVEDWVYGDELPEGLYDSLGRQADQLGIETELLLELLNNSYQPPELR